MQKFGIGRFGVGEGREREEREWYLYRRGGLAGRFEVCREIRCCGGSWRMGRRLASMLCRTELVDGGGVSEKAHPLSWG